MNTAPPSPATPPSPAPGPGSRWSTWSFPRIIAVDADSLTQLGIAAARRSLTLDSTVADAHLALATRAGRTRSGSTRRMRSSAECWRWCPTMRRRTCGTARLSRRRAGWMTHSRRLAPRLRSRPALRGDHDRPRRRPPLRRRYPEAFAAARRALELDSTFTCAHVILAQLHGLTGDPTAPSPSSDWTLRRTLPLLARRGMARLGGLGLQLAGRRADVERMRAEIARQPEPADSYDEAMAAMALGDLGRAVQGIARSLERHELLGGEQNPGCTPVLDPLRSCGAIGS